MRALARSLLTRTRPKQKEAEHHGDGAWQLPVRRRPGGEPAHFCFQFAGVCSGSRAECL